MQDIFGYSPPLERARFIRDTVWRALRHWRTLAYPGVILASLILAFSIIIHAIPSIGVATLGSPLLIVLNYPLNKMFDYYYHLSVLDAEARQHAIIAAADSIDHRYPQEFTVYRAKIRSDAELTVQELNWRKRTFLSNEVAIDVIRFIIPLLANAVFAVIV